MTSLSYTYGIAIVHCVLQITHTAKQMIRECVVTVSQSQTDTHAPWAPPMGIDLAPRNYVGGGVFLSSIPACSMPLLIGNIPMMMSFRQGNLWEASTNIIIL